MHLECCQPAYSAAFTICSICWVLRVVVSWRGAIVLVRPSRLLSDNKISAVDSSSFSTCPHLTKLFVARAHARRHRQFTRLTPSSGDTDRWRRTVLCCSLSVFLISSQS